MKKIYNVMMLAAVAAAALVSCAKEMDKPEVAPQGDGINVTVVTANDGETKTALSGEKSVVWVATDKVGFFNHTADVNVESSAASIDGEGKATFTATVPSAGTYYAYYPYQADKYAPDAEGVTVRIPNAQNPTPATFDPKADLLVSTSFEADGSTDTPATIKFKRLASIIRIQFVDNTTGGVLADEYATSVAVQGEANLSGRFKISGTEGLIDMSSGNKKITATYEANTYKLTQSGDYAFFGVKPQTLGKGSTLIITAITGKYNISKTITMPKDIVLGAGDILPITVNISDAEVQHVSISRLWKKIPRGLGQAWTTEYTSTGSFIQGNDRAAAMDEDNVYVVAASSTTKGILAIDKDDPTNLKEVNVTGIEGGFFETACVRTIWNPTMNKYMLLVGTLCFESGNHFKVYAYKNGINNAPECVLDFTDSQNRRFGDMFTVVGDWSNGELWIRNTDSPSTIFWKITDGVFGSALGGNIGYNGSKGKGALYKYSVEANQVFLSNIDLGAFYNYTASTWIESFSGVVWKGVDNSARLRRYGVTPFEFAGRQYIAYTYIGRKSSDTEKNGARGRLKIIEDQGSASTFLASMEADKVVYECPIQNDNDNASTVSEFDAVPYIDDPSIVKQTLASCSVVPVGDAIYIMAHIDNVGLSVFKMTLE